MIRYLALVLLAMPILAADQQKVRDPLKFVTGRINHETIVIQDGSGKKVIAQYDQGYDKEAWERLRKQAAKLGQAHMLKYPGEGRLSSLKRFDQNYSEQELLNAINVFLDQESHFRLVITDSGVYMVTLCEPVKDDRKE